MSGFSESDCQSHVHIIIAVYIHTYLHVADYSDYGKLVAIDFIVLYSVYIHPLQSWAWESGCDTPPSPSSRQCEGDTLGRR